MTLYLYTALNADLAGSRYVQIIHCKNLLKDGNFITMSDKHHQLRFLEMLKEKMAHIALQTRCTCIMPFDLKTSPFYWLRL